MCMLWILVGKISFILLFLNYYDWYIPFKGINNKFYKYVIKINRENID